MAIGNAEIKIRLELEEAKNACSGPLCYATLDSVLLRKSQNRVVL